MVFFQESDNYSYLLHAIQLGLYTTYVISALSTFCLIAQYTCRICKTC
jgi:hypothetical protein